MFALERSATPMITGTTTRRGSDGTAYRADRADSAQPPRRENAAQRAIGTDSATESAIAGRAIHRCSAVSSPISARFEDSQVMGALLRDRRLRAARARGPRPRPLPA